MGKGYAAKMNDLYDRLFNAGLSTGEQFAADVFARQMYAHGISANKIIEITEAAIADGQNYDAMLDVKHNPEADVLQEHFDAPLRKIFREKYVPWQQRYEWIKQIKY